MQATRVLLIEAGADTPPDAIPADIADTFPSSSLNGDYFWPDLTAVRSEDGGSHPFPQARVMGGGSSVMGLWALRGMPADFDAWAAAGADGWAWDDVREVYRRLENDEIRPRPNREPGPMPIMRVPRGEWPPLAEAIAAATKARGLAQIDDINEQPGDGFFAMPLSQDGGGRASSARCYLTDAVRRRGNLDIMTAARVTALNVSGGRVTGVTVERHGATSELGAREVIVCAGAIHSPALLLRSGIGPAAALQKAGIAVAADRPGVGQNLQNHVYLHFALTVPPPLRLAASLRRFAIAGMRLSSREARSPASDLLLFLIGRVSPRAFGTSLCMLGAALYSPYSRGQVTVDGPQADRPPRIEFNMLGDPRDRSRLLKAARYAETLLRDPAVAATYGDAFLLPPVMALNQFNRPGAAGALIAALAKAVLEAPPPLQRAIIGRAIRPGRWLANRSRKSAVSDEELLARRRAHGACGGDLRHRPQGRSAWRLSTRTAASMASAACAWSTPR